jgi:hypothetical protein
MKYYLPVSIIYKKTYFEILSFPLIFLRSDSPDACSQLILAPIESSQAQPSFGMIITIF